MCQTDPANTTDFHAAATQPNAADNNASDMPPNLTLVSCDLNRWPPDPRSSKFYVLAPRIICAKLHQNWFIHF